MPEALTPRTKMTSTLIHVLKLGVGAVVAYNAVLLTAALSVPELAFGAAVLLGLVSLLRRRFEFVAHVLAVHSPPPPELTLVSTQPLTLAWSAGRSKLAQPLSTSLIDVSSSGADGDPLRWATQVPSSAGETMVELGELPPNLTTRIRVWSVGSRDGLKVASNPVIISLPESLASNGYDADMKGEDEARRSTSNQVADSKPDLAMILHATSFEKQREAAEQELRVLSSNLQEEESGLHSELRALKEIRRQEESTRKSLLRGLREMEDNRKAAEIELQRKQKECADFGDLVNSTAATADTWSAELKNIREGASLTAESVNQLANQRRAALAENLSSKIGEANELRDIVNRLREQVLGLEAEIKVAWDTIANLAITSPAEPFGHASEWQQELLILQGEAARRQTEASTLEALLVDESRQKMALLQQLAAATR